MQVGTTAKAYDHSDRTIYILVFSQNLFFGGKLENSLMNSSQLHENGLVVHTCPKQYDRNSMHCVFMPQDNITIHFAMYWVISYIPCRLRTDKELEECRNLQMTEDKECDPYNNVFEEREEATLQTTT